MPVSHINSFFLNNSWQPWEWKMLQCLVVPHSFNYCYCTTSSQTSFFLPIMEMSSFLIEEMIPRQPTAVLILSLIFILGERSQLINLSPPPSRQQAWERVQDVLLGPSETDVQVCESRVHVRIPQFSPSLAPHPSTTAATNLWGQGRLGCAGNPSMNVGQWAGLCLRH